MGLVKRRDAWKVLEQQMRKHAISQSALASMMEIPRQTVWRWINLREPPNTCHQLMLRKLFHIELEEWLSHDDKLRLRKVDWSWS